MDGRAEGSGTASGLVAVTMWGLAPTRALVLHLAPLPLLVLRVTVAGLILAPAAIRMLRGLDRAHAPRLVAAGLLGMIGYNLPPTDHARRRHGVAGC